MITVTGEMVENFSVIQVIVVTLVTMAPFAILVSTGSISWRLRMIK